MNAMLPVRRLPCTANPRLYRKALSADTPPSSLKAVEGPCSTAGRRQAEPHRQWDLISVEGSQGRLPAWHAACCQPLLGRCHAGGRQHALMRLWPGLHQLVDLLAGSHQSCEEQEGADGGQQQQGSMPQGCFRPCHLGSTRTRSGLTTCSWRQSCCVLSVLSAEGC